MEKFVSGMANNQCHVNDLLNPSYNGCLQSAIGDNYRYQQGSAVVQRTNEYLPQLGVSTEKIPSYPMHSDCIYTPYPVPYPVPEHHHGMLGSGLGHVANFALNVLDSVHIGVMGRHGRFNLGEYGYPARYGYSGRYSFPGGYGDPSACENLGSYNYARGYSHPGSYSYPDLYNYHGCYNYADHFNYPEGYASCVDRGLFNINANGYNNGGYYNGGYYNNAGYYNGGYGYGYGTGLLNLAFGSIGHLGHLGHYGSFGFHRFHHWH